MVHNKERLKFIFWPRNDNTILLIESECMEIWKYFKKNEFPVTHEGHEKVTKVINDGWQNHHYTATQANKSIALEVHSPPGFFSPVMVVQSL